MSGGRLYATRLWSAATALALVFLFPLAGSAQPAYPRAGDPDTGYVSSRQQLHELSLRLESLAARARDRAKVDSRRHGSEELAERMSDFTKDAHNLRLLTDERDVPASKINDEIRKLVDDAQKVQKESARAKHHDPQTDDDWNRTVEVLDRINNQYLAATGLAWPRATAGTYGPDRFENRRAMITDLDRRADDAARLAESANLEIAPEIDRLRDQIRSYRQSAERLSPSDTRANVTHMLVDARAVQSDLSGSNASGQLRDDVNAIVGMLAQMRDMNLERPEGTSGYGLPPGAVDRDDQPGPYGRYATADTADLARDLDARAARANALAVQSDYDDIANDISHFRGWTREVYDREASMSREDRREALDSLLKDAQKTQRDLARRHLSGDLAAQWDRVVDLLVRMRNAE